MSCPDWLPPLRSSLAALLACSLASAQSGPPQFGPAQTLPVLPTASGLAAGDFDEDGHTDLATANWSVDALSILLGAGYGAFSAAPSDPVGDVPLRVHDAALCGVSLSNAATARVP